MSFIEQSEQNVDRLMKEVSGGSVGGFVGTGGTRIDTLFAGGFHPDYGEIDKLHKQSSVLIGFDPNYNYYMH